ncbi:MAG TPA: alpha-hydroxy acid oxidase [Marmoricola sp.]|nr:alpha-hydroxy acid oxidase [Marmoricola sp.]
MGTGWLASLEDEAGRVLPSYVHEYVRQGSGGSVSADEAADAWSRYRLVPRVLRGNGEVDATASFLGYRATAPFGVAPTTLQRAADLEGELAMARGCAAAGVPMVLSSNAATGLEEIGRSTAHWWLQAYLTEDRELVRPLLAAACKAGAAAIVLTVDTPVVARKHDGGGVSALELVPARWLRTNLGPAADAAKARDLGLADIAWIRAATGLPVVVKGVLHPADADAAVDAGAAAVWVSNHGGRQLDRAVPTALALADVVVAVRERVPVYVDGGIRSGIDTLTALALGADAVFVGRLPFYALAVEGAAGVRRLFTALSEDLREALLLSGCTDLVAAKALTVRVL